MGPGPISRVEDRILAVCRERLGQTVRAIESLPGRWDQDMLRRALRMVPGVYVGFLGGKADEDRMEPEIAARYNVYAVTGHASGELARRRGDPVAIGAYEILERVIPGLHNLTIDGIGTMELRGIENIYSGKLDNQGVAVYGAAFEIPLTFEPPVLPEDLSDFITFDAQYDVEPHHDREQHEKWVEEPPDYSASQPEAHDTVTLPHDEE